LPPHGTVDQILWRHGRLPHRSSASSGVGGGVAPGTLPRVTAFARPRPGPASSMLDAPPLSLTPCPSPFIRPRPTIAPRSPSRPCARRDTPDGASARPSPSLCKEWSSSLDPSHVDGHLRDTEHLPSLHRMGIPWFVGRGASTLPSSSARTLHILAREVGPHPGPHPFPSPMAGSRQAHP